MEREKHHQKKFGNGPAHQHLKEGSYNKHAGAHRGNEEKEKERMKKEHKEKFGAKKPEHHSFI